MPLNTTRDSDTVYGIAFLGIVVIAAVVCQALHVAVLSPRELGPPGYQFYSTNTSQSRGDRAELISEAECAVDSWRTRPACTSACQAAGHPEPLPEGAEWGGVLCHACGREWRGGDALFAAVEEMQGTPPPWRGGVLDAGTGALSLPYVAAWSAGDCVAVTASSAMHAEVSQINARQAHPCDVVLGRWSDDSLLQGQEFRLILADYLIGAVEGFEPYTQERILRRLVRHLAPGGTMYLVAAAPFPRAPPTPLPTLPPSSPLPPHLFSASYSQATQMLVDAANLRDSAVLLSGEPPYREFPLHFYRSTAEAAGLRVGATRVFAGVYGQEWVASQLQVARAHLTKPALHPATASALRRWVMELQQAASHNADLTTGVCFGTDFVISASR